MTTLDAVMPGTAVIIHDVVEPGATHLRLFEMGMVPETRIVVTRRALFGDPIEVEVRGTRLCLRRADAACFRVRDP